ncbi:MAG: hypothetical protein IPM74_12500 [Crocinitomicaceae bacterium]|nr:hypothetical protein [Crocinitomicaceae bacterium]MBK8926696.1 hypothetical protein [Crocinitomicaceae bacterium]
MVDIKGVEVLLQKTKGKLKGWIAYTLSTNTRQFDEINNGDPFYFKYDRRHNLSVVATYDINENISLSATWVFGTGNPITLAQGKYDLVVAGFNWANYSQSLIADNTFQAHIYNGKNAYRLPAYHRLDFGITLKKEKPRGLRSWQFGIYNVYNKLNPFFLYYKSVDSNIKLFQLSLFPILPAVSYTFRFN